MLSVFMCFFIKISSSSLNTMLIVDRHCGVTCCDEFSVPQIDRQSKQVKEQWHEKFYLQSVWGKTRYIKHQKYQNLWMNNKVTGDENAVWFNFLPHLLFIHKFWHFRYLKWRVFPTLITNIIFHLTVLFACLLLRSICGTGKSSQQTSLQCLSKSTRYSVMRRSFW